MLRGNGRAKARHSAWGALPTAIQYGVPLLAVVLFLVALALIPPSWRAILGVVLWLVVLPLGLLRLSARGERRDTSAWHPLRTRPQPPDLRKGRYQHENVPRIAPVGILLSIVGSFGEGLPWLTASAC